MIVRMLNYHHLPECANSVLCKRGYIKDQSFLVVISIFWSTSEVIVVGESIHKDISEDILFLYFGQYSGSCLVAEGRNSAPPLTPTVPPLFWPLRCVLYKRACVLPWWLGIIILMMMILSWSWSSSCIITSSLHTAIAHCP